MKESITKSQANNLDESSAAMEGLVALGLLRSNEEYFFSTDPNFNPSATVMPFGVLCYLRINGYTGPKSEYAPEQ